MFWSNSKTAKGLLLLLPVALITGCSKTGFNTIDPEIKTKLMADQYVFDNPPGRAPASESSDGSSDPYGNSNPPAENSVGSTDPVSSPVAPRPDMPSSGGSTGPGNDTITLNPIPPAPGSGVKPSEGGFGTPPLTGSPGTLPPPVALPSPALPPTVPALPEPVVSPVTPPVAEVPAVTELPVFLVCSNNETKQKGENLRSTSTLKVEVIQYKLEAGQNVEVSRCTEDDPGLAAQLISTKTLTFSKCAPKGSLVKTEPVRGQVDFFAVDVIADGGVSLLSHKGNSQKLKILYDINGVKKKKQAGFSTTAAHQALCDANASPLFVDMRSEYERTKKFTLTAPWAGVVFDILGKNADPAPHTPDYISWFESSSMAYITLPNKRGQVLGIDQLFGDNTLGPDGEFAANGYAALAKYDSNKDQLINSEDAVYAKLKIWQDRNHDGKAAASELTSLSDAKIEVIDLNYDSTFSEKDIYGNTIMYKSVAKMADGEYRLVFDIWFELNLYKAKQRLYEVARR